MEQNIAVMFLNFSHREQGDKKKGNPDLGLFVKAAP
jgi:hypothetical protein